MTFELLPDIGCIGFVGLLYDDPTTEEDPELLANFDVDELRELKQTIEVFLKDFE